MKTIKYILSILLIISGIRAIIEGSIISGFLFIILAILILPQSSTLIKNNFSLWNNKPIRYIGYIILIVIAGAALPKENKEKNKHVEKKEVRLKSNNKERKHNIKTCIYGGDESHVIPDLIAADIYLNYEKLGFKIDKQIETDHTNILCTLKDRYVQYNVMAIGCSPDEIIKVTATALDYSGENQKEIADFFGYVATLPYKNSEPERAKQWCKNNININGAETTIGGVELNINFKSANSKVLTIIHQ